MVNQVSGEIVGSCHRGLERIKRKLAFNGMALTAKLRRPPWWHLEVLLEENSLLQLLSLDLLYLTVPLM